MAHVAWSRLQGFDWLQHLTACVVAPCWPCGHLEHLLPHDFALTSNFREEVEAGETQLFLDAGRPLREVRPAAG